MILPVTTGVLLLSYTRFFEPLAEGAVALISRIGGFETVAMAAGTSRWVRSWWRVGPA